MKKLNLAIIGQGRSGKNIHGVYYLSDFNKYYTVKYVVDADERRRQISEKRYVGCETFADYRELYTRNDIDLVVNATYSDMHFSITKDLLEHNLNVLVEKPFARNRFECQTLIRTAKEHGVVLAVFQNTFFAPFYLDALEKAKAGLFGKIEQVSVRYNNFARRWDWQTMQRKLGGSAYNTGPHPIGIALGFLDFSPETEVVYAKAAHSRLSSGDADDYVKILLSAPDKPLVDVEISAMDAYSDYCIKIQGDRGSFRCTATDYKYRYMTEGENPERPLVEHFLYNENFEPIFCGEKLIVHEESGRYTGDAFDVAPAKLYENLYYAITRGDALLLPPECAEAIVGVIETVHAHNPLPLRY